MPSEPASPFARSHAHTLPCQHSYASILTNSHITAHNTRLTPSRVTRHQLPALAGWQLAIAPRVAPDCHEHVPLFPSSMHQQPRPRWPYQNPNCRGPLTQERAGYVNEHRRTPGRPRKWRSPCSASTVGRFRPPRSAPRGTSPPANLPQPPGFPSAPRPPPLRSAPLAGRPGYLGAGNGAGLVVVVVV